jgi:hypothetical protein
MGAAVRLAVRLDTVADHATLAMRTGRREHVNRAFEAVEYVRALADGDLERLVIVVPADLAFRHCPVRLNVRPEWVHSAGHLPVLKSGVELDQCVPFMRVKSTPVEWQLEHEAPRVLVDVRTLPPGAYSPHAQPPAPALAEFGSFIIAA